MQGDERRGKRTEIREVKKKERKEAIRKGRKGNICKTRGVQRERENEIKMN